MVGFCHLTDSHHNHHGQKPTMVGTCHGGNMLGNHLLTIVKQQLLSNLKYCTTILLHPIKFSTIVNYHLLQLPLSPFKDCTPIPTHQILNRSPPHHHIQFLTIINYDCCYTILQIVQLT